MRCWIAAATALSLAGVGLLVVPSATGDAADSCGVRLQMRILRHLDLSGFGQGTDEAEEAGSEEIVIPDGGTYDLPALYTKGSEDAYVVVFIEPVEDPDPTRRCRHRISPDATHRALSITYADGRTEDAPYGLPDIERAYVGGTKPADGSSLTPRDVPEEGTVTWTAALRCDPGCKAHPSCGEGPCASGTFTIRIVP